MRTGTLEKKCFVATIAWHASVITIITILMIIIINMLLNKRFFWQMKKTNHNASALSLKLINGHVFINNDFRFILFFFVTMQVFVVLFEGNSIKSASRWIWMVVYSANPLNLHWPSVLNLIGYFAGLMYHRCPPFFSQLSFPQPLLFSVLRPHYFLICLLLPLTTDAVQVDITWLRLAGSYPGACDAERARERLIHKLQLTPTRTKSA